MLKYLFPVADSAYSVWLGLRFYPGLTEHEPGFAGRPQDVGLTWDDGTLLDGNKLKLGSNDPVRDSKSDYFVFYTNKLIDDATETGLFGCMCQANIHNISNCN